MPEQMTTLTDLADKYFEQIRVESTGYGFLDAVNRTSSYYAGAQISISIPAQMLLEYLQVANLKRRLPHPAEFWRETDLTEKLRNYKRAISYEEISLDEILNLLQVNIIGSYENLDLPEDACKHTDLSEILKNLPERVAILIAEVQEPFPEEDDGTYFH